MPIDQLLIRLIDNQLLVCYQFNHSLIDHQLDYLIKYWLFIINLVTSQSIIDSVTDN